MSTCSFEIFDSSTLESVIDSTVPWSGIFGVADCSFPCTSVVVSSLPTGLISTTVGT